MLFEPYARGRGRCTVAASPAIAATSKTLDGLAQKHGCSVSELLHKAETSSKFEEDFLEARHLRMTLSSLKKL